MASAQQSAAYCTFESDPQKEDLENTRRLSNAPLQDPIVGQTGRTVGMSLWIASLIMFAEGFGFTQFFPYGVRMTALLQGSSSAGAYCGLLYSANSMGMLVTQRMWAELSLRYGCRRCLMASNMISLCAYVGAGFANNYWVIFAIMLCRGLLNCNLPVARTALRMSYQHRGEDDTQAFSMLSTAFAASCISGPAVGGLLYDYGGPYPWSGVLFLSAAFYVLPLCFRFDDVPCLDESEQEISNVRPPKLLLVMGAAHSALFMGWEFAYPLLAASKSGENWDTARVGMTFLVGNVCLMFYSLLIYKLVAKHVGNLNLWILQWLLPTVLVTHFPWILSATLDRYTSQSTPVMLLNFSVQAVVSVMVGSLFITIQLLINQEAERQSAPRAALALCNGWLASSQASARCAIPLLLGWITEIEINENHSAVFVFLGALCLISILAALGYRKEQPASLL